MEEQKQTHTPASTEQGDGAKNRNRNHRRRHHNNKNNRPRPEGASAPESKGATPQKEESNQQKGNNHKNQKTEKAQTNQSPAGQGASSKGNNKKRNRNHNKKGGRGVEKPLYNPYEEPSPEELSLDELRARIVLNPNSSDTLKLQKDTDREKELAAIEIESLDGYPPVDRFAVSASDEGIEKIEVVGIRFRAAGKMYYFDPNGTTAQKGEFAIVETARGPEFGSVCLGNSMVAKNLTVSPLRPILRIATKEDIAHNEENRKKEIEALKICQEKILAHKLEMKLIDAQYAFDNSKLLFYFTSEGRVDFRDLVKSLASVFRTRIELRQIGIRDEAKMLGGLGACGRALCCSTFLPDFAQVSIKMAKEQNLSLNSAKISGCCGRLMCCLRFESDVYAEEIKKTPPVDALVKTEDGIGYVISTNPLAGTVRVVLKDSPDVAPKQYHRNEVTVLEKDRKRAADRAKEASENAKKD